MSDPTNTTLIERGYALAEEITSHPSGYDKLILDAIQDNDLTLLQHYITWVEGELAQQHFHNYDIVVF